MVKYAKIAGWLMLSLFLETVSCLGTHLKPGLFMIGFGGGYLALREAVLLAIAASPPDTGEG